MINKSNAINKTNPIGIHKGDVTHHQDHVILLVNFRTIKIKNRIIPNPIPPDVFLFSLMIICF